MSPLEDDGGWSRSSSAEDWKVKGQPHSTHAATSLGPPTAAQAQAQASDKARMEPRSLSDYFLHNALPTVHSQAEATGDSYDSSAAASSSRDPPPPPGKSTSSAEAAGSSALLSAGQTGDGGRGVEMTSLGGAAETRRGPARCNYFDSDSEAEKQEALRYAKVAEKLLRDKPSMMRSMSAVSTTSSSSSSSSYSGSSSSPRSLCESVDVGHDPAGVSNAEQHDRQVTSSAQVHRAVEPSQGNLRDSMAVASKISLGQTSTEKSSAEDEYSSQVPEASYRTAKNQEQEAARTLNEETAERCFVTRTQPVGDRPRPHGHGDVRSARSESRVGAAYPELQDSAVSGLRQNSSSSTEQGASSLESPSCGTYSVKSFVSADVLGPRESPDEALVNKEEDLSRSSLFPEKQHASSPSFSPVPLEVDFGEGRGPDDDHHVTVFGRTRASASKSGSSAESSPAKRGQDITQHVTQLGGSRITSSEPRSSNESSPAKLARSNGNHVTIFGAASEPVSTSNSLTKRGPDGNHNITVFGGSRVTASKPDSETENSPAKRVTTDSSGSDHKSHDTAEQPAEKEELRTERKKKKKRKNKRKKIDKLNAEGGLDAGRSHAKANGNHHLSPVRSIMHPHHSEQHVHWSGEGDHSP